ARAELRKVVWPTREEAIRYTIIVIAISVGVALFLGAFDYIFHFILNRLIP
ncbi:preprotein translocase subunit SecE, partial [Patescibacteria group bacterium]|nr:preprotein translocase subunit SecE [Patescibacteria group bacterium]